MIKPVVVHPDFFISMPIALSFDGIFNVFKNISDNVSKTKDNNNYCCWQSYYTT